MIKVNIKGKTLLVPTRHNKSKNTHLLSKDYDINIINPTNITSNITSNIGFIITRYVNNILTNNYWKESYNCIRKLYLAENGITQL